MYQKKYIMAFVCAILCVRHAKLLVQYSLVIISVTLMSVRSSCLYTYIVISSTENELHIHHSCTKNVINNTIVLLLLTQSNNSILSSLLKYAFNTFELFGLQILAFM